ncbi:UDPGT domain containing protein [Trichuris trichiura]|uniref:UDP-glucuronosyltransferase n=1 Tax=Trichuris trichiura TaxID=36087 RepID=A0A077Z8L2_TRITR|nr:UDPGT domain containing protein [Trichuris trichiura]
MFIPATGATSHVKSMLPLAENLLKDGHNVSLLQYYNEEKQKVTHDSIQFTYVLTSDGQKEIYQNLSTLNWDLLIVDNLLQPCGIVLSTNTKGRPWIDYSTTAMLKHIRRYRAVNVPPSVDVSPLIMEEFQPTNFKNRVLSAIEHVLECILLFSLSVAMTMPWLAQSAMLSIEHVNDFHTNAVYSLGSLSTKLDVTLPQTMNTFSIDYACPKAAKLNYEYQKFVEDPASRGTIVFSFGHTADWKEAPTELIKAISSAFENLSQYHIVWQFNGNISIVSSSAHLRIEPWIPLPSLLQHSKTVLFITHSGIKSFREAVCFAVPMLSIPLFGDQVRNTILAKFHGLGVRLDKTRLTEETFYKGILSVLHDSGYKQRITKLSAMLSDNLIDETKKGSFWINFYLRHPHSASHMRLKGITMTTFSYHSYDLLAIVCVLLLAFHCGIYY